MTDRAAQPRWPLVALAALAATAALVRDVPAVSALWAIAAAITVLLYFLVRPAAWVWWFLALGLLLPPLPFEVGGVELPFHPAMAAFAAGLFVVWVRLREWRIERSAISATSALLLGATLISLPWAFYYSGTAVGVQSVIRWILLASGFLLMLWIAGGPKARALDGAGGPMVEAWSGAGLLWMILGAALLSSAFAIVDFQYQLPRTVRFSEQYIYSQDAALRRAQGVFYDASALGNFCAMILTLILALGRNARRALRLPAWLLWIPVPTLAVALVLSFSRGSVVNLLVALTALAWMRRKTLARRSIVTFVALALAISAAGLLIAPQLLLPYGSRLQYSAVELFSNPNEVLSKRLDTWNELGGFILDHPAQVLLGIGYKSLPYTSYFSRPLVADNMYLALLMESGLPGLLALLLFCAALLSRTRSLARDPDDGVAGLGRFLFCFWLGEMAQMLSGDILTFWRVTPVYLAILGLALRGTRSESTRPSGVQVDN